MLDIPFVQSPIVRPESWMLNGDHMTVSADISPFRLGSGSMLPPGSPLYVLAGNQLVMWYQCHNSAIDERGQFYPREDPGTCSLIAYCEDDSIRYFSAPAAAKGTSPVWTQQMTINMITGAITPSQTGGIIGTTAANNANAGAVGELLTATIASPGTSLTTATPTNVVVAGLSLTAGDWDLWGNCCFLPAATTSITQLACGMSATTNTLPAAGSGLFQVTQAATVPTAIPQCFSVQPVRVSIASTTSWFMVAQGAFTVSTLSAFGTLLARRVR